MNTVERDAKVIAWYLFALTIVSLAASTLPIEFLWGMRWSSFVPLTGRIIFVLIAFMGILPMVRDSIVAILSGLESRAPRAVSTIAQLGLIAAIAVLFHIFLSNNPLLGDTFSILTRSADAKDVAGLSWLNLLLHEQTSKLIGGSPAQATLSAYRLTGLVSGVALLLAARYFTKSLAQFLVSLAVIGTFGIVQLYFGYVERYPTTYALMFIFLVSAQRDLDRKKLSIFTPLLLLLATGFHLAAGVLLPAYITSLYLIKRSRAVVIGGVLVCIAGLVAAYLVVQHQAEVESAFLPMVPALKQPYAFFTLEHFLDLVNIALLSFPLVLPLLISKTLRRLPERLFLLSAVIPAMLFALIVDPKLGAMRDWDLVSLPAPILIFVGLLLLRNLFEENPKLGYSLLLPSLAFALLHSGAWVYANTFQGKSYEQMKPYIRADLHYSPEADSDFLNVRYAEIVHRIYGDDWEGILAQKRRLIAHPDDHRNRRNLALNLSHYGHHAEADSLVRDCWQDFSFTPQLFNELMRIFQGAGNLTAQDELISKALTVDPGSPYLYSELSAVKENRGQLDSAYIYGARAEHAKPQTTPEGIERLIRLARQVGLTREADSLELGLKATQ